LNKVLEIYKDEDSARNRFAQRFLEQAAERRLGISEIQVADGNLFAPVHVCAGSTAERSKKRYKTKKGDISKEL